MRTSARNQWVGRVAHVREGPVTSEVSVDLQGGDRFVATVTTASVAALGLQPGEPVTALVKASHVLLARD